MSTLAIVLTTIGVTLFTNSAYADAPTAWQLLFQDPASPLMEGIIDLHHQVMFFGFLILTSVTYILAVTLIKFNAKAHPKTLPINHHTTLEFVWTVVPIVVLVIIGIPSFQLLYSMEEVVNPSVTLKVVGHQWYWSYEYSDYSSEQQDALSFDSYIVPEEDLEEGQLRLLEVDNRVVLPTDTHIRFIITAADVLHSWTVPSFGVKVDAVPGRLNQGSVFINREGVYYGQCSEICGVNHGFMPIVVEAVSPSDYVSWVESSLELD